MALPSLGPINRVPYDMLTEIFVHCLPQRRLEHCQPNTAIAPMLLCHVCSTWRTVALATATLWTHLSCCLTVDGERSRYEDGNWIVRKNEYEFLLWWKNNQRSTDPLYLCLALDWNDQGHSETDISEPTFDSELELDQAGMVSLFEYVSSAKYIEANEIYWFIVGLRIQHGYPIAYPVPHTMVVPYWLEPFDSFWFDYFQSFYQDQLTLIPNDSPSALRHLYLAFEIPLFTFKIPMHWSSLTHVALLVAGLSLGYWYALIRAVPQLQLGRFQFKVLDDNDKIKSKPIPCTLAQLSTLSITINVDVMHDNSERRFPLAMLVTALHLPALRDLSLDSAQEWSDHLALPHISAVLDVAPAITTLTLGPSFLTLENDEEYARETLPRIKSSEPVWRRAPHLAHLRLVAHGTFAKLQMRAGKRGDALVRNLFHNDSRWLGLHDAACPLRRVTVIDRLPWDREADRIAEDRRACIREHAGGAPGVKAVFDVVFETEEEAICGAWNEWGPNLQ